MDNQSTGRGFESSDDEKVFQSNCSTCGITFRNVKSKKKRKLDGDDKKEMREFLNMNFNTTVRERGLICNICYMKWIHSKPTCSKQMETNQPTQSTSQTDQSNTQELVTIKSATLDEHHCLVCDVKTRINLPRLAAFNVYISNRIYIREGARCCESHLVDGKLSESAISSLIIQMTTQPFSEVEKLVNYLCEEVSRDKKLPQTYEAWPDTHCQEMTGHEKHQISVLVQKYLADFSVRDTKYRTK
jgi:hypothetical protein